MYKIGGQAVCFSNSCMPEMCSNTRTKMCSSTLLTFMISNLLQQAVLLKHAKSSHKGSVCYSTASRASYGDMCFSTLLIKHEFDTINEFERACYSTLMMLMTPSLLQ